MNQSFTTFKLNMVTLTLTLILLISCVANHLLFQDIQEKHSQNIGMTDEMNIIDEIESLQKRSILLQRAIIICAFIIIIMQIINFLKSRSISTDIDVFTGLYNRNKYTKTIERLTIENVDEVGILILDINGLRSINDEYGSIHGDKLILKVVSIMKLYFFDDVFRTGCDEFIVISSGLNRTSFEEKVLEFRKTLTIQPNISVAIGSAWSSDKDNIYSQIAFADAQMQIDKINHYKNLKVKIKSYKATTAIQLQESIKANEFIVLLQPKIRLTDETVVGAEALVRKKSRDGKLITPDNFIFSYESDGIIPLLDFHVLEIVCEQLKKWCDEGLPIIPLSVNFSRITILEYDVAHKANDICVKNGIDPKFITIELTERISNFSYNSLQEIIESIKMFGFKISLDDFGREYSNLSMIANIAFDEIKIDKSLIDNLASSFEISTALRSLVAMCDAFRPTNMVVEGIETYEQIEKLREIGCLPIVQGYYYSKPLPIDDFLLYYLKNKG